MYNTQQRTALLELLNNSPDREFTAGEIAAELQRASTTPISLSAVYRNLAAMEKKGQVVRKRGKNNRENYYRYVHSHHCEDKLHMTCMQCGKTFHINDRITAELLESARKLDGFLIDTVQTVLYGTCPACIIQNKTQ